MQRGIAGTLSSPRLGGIAVLAGLAGGCLANGGDESIIVLKNVVPTATATSCMVTSTESETALAGGALDVSVGRGYEFIAQIKSRITADPGAELQRTIFVHGANVDITFPNSTLFSDAEFADLKAKALTHFMSPFSGFLAPNGGITDVFLQLIPPELGAAIMAKPNFASVLALGSFKVIGDLAGGEVTSQLFQYPISITNGGLVHDEGLCSLLPATFTPRTGNPCNPGQDGVTDCCTDAGGRVCPAVGTKM